MQDHLFSVEGRPLSSHTHAGRPPLPPQPVARLLLFGLARLCALLPLSVTLKVPTGAFLPAFVTGAALGRAFGQLLEQAGVLHGAQPGHLAVCGAAALTAAVTRTTSTGVVALELTGQMALQLPLLVSTTSAYLVGSALGSPSIFDVMRNHKENHSPHAPATEGEATLAPPIHLAEPLLPSVRTCRTASATASHATAKQLA